MRLHTLFSITGLMVPIFAREFQVGLPKLIYRTIDDFRSPRNLPLSFRKFELLHRYAMNLMGILIVTLQSFNMHYILYANFMLLRHIEHLDNITLFLLTCWSCLLQTFWVVVLHVGGMFREQSKVNFRSWKQIDCKGNFLDQRYISKFKRSCRPLSIGYEGMFVMRKLSVLKFLRGVVRGTFRIFLTLKGTNI